MGGCWSPSLGLCSSLLHQSRWRSKEPKSWSSVVCSMVSGAVWDGALLVALTNSGVKSAATSPAPVPHRPLCSHRWPNRARSRQDVVSPPGVIRAAVLEDSPYLRQGLRAIDIDETFILLLSPCPSLLQHLLKGERGAAE